MHYISENHILLFLIQIFLLLGAARALGEVFRRWGQPAITAEIVVGIFFGPTILGRVWPEIHQFIFPVDNTQMDMLETVAWLGILFFLLQAGLETNFATAWRQRKEGALLSFSDLIIPATIGFIGCMFLPRHYVGDGGSIVTFGIFAAVIMTISALPVTARVMQDLKVYRTDMGLLIMSALTINDVAGWVLFAIILGFFGGTVVSFWSLVFVLAGTIVFAGVCLTVGPKLFDGIMGLLKRNNVPEPSGSLTLVCLCGLAGGAITTWIGIHGLFGFFIAGIMVGESKYLSEHTRHIFSQMVQGILVPIFFASIGLKLDFVGEFDILLAAFFFLVGIFGRYIGAYIGARLIHQPKMHSRFISFAHIPGGEMQIVIGMVALEYGVITQTAYVAIVFGAIMSSVVAGPMMRRVLKGVKRVDWLAYLPLDHVIADIAADTREQAIGVLAEQAQRFSDILDADRIREAVLAREEQMTTALENGIAIPHARIDELEQPIVLFARSLRGIEWDAADGKPANILLLILTPSADSHVQLQVLQGISNTFINESVCDQLMSAGSVAEIIERLRRASRPNG